MNNAYGLQAVQEANLKILKEIHRICEKYRISYALDSGTLLGAIRHGGFIPWDDDLDISMYRKDFRRLAACIEEELPEEIGFYYVGGKNKHREQKGVTIFFKWMRTSKMTLFAISALSITTSIIA